MTARYRSRGALRACLVLLATAVGLSSLSMLPAAAAPGHEAPPQAAAAIRAANADWLPAMRRADAAAIAAPYAQDGLFIGADGTVTRGREAIRQLYVVRLAAIAQVISGDLHSDGSAPAGSTLVYEWGHATLAVTKQDGSRAESAGTYLTVWRRNPVGRWEIIRNIVF
jgi:uncharacterized protein (TIGR02246 family)